MKSKIEKKAALEDILQILEKQSEVLYKLQIAQENDKSETLPIIYSNGYDLLIKKDRIRPLQNWKSKLKSAKITRAAKNLMIMFNSEFSEMLTETISQILKKIKLSNENGFEKNLSPSKNVVPYIIEEEINSLKKNFKILWNNYSLAIFNNARQHQVLFNQKTPLKKFISDVHIDLDKYELELNTAIHDYEQELKMNSQSYLADNENKKTLLSGIEKYHAENV